jgi:hypothetical protein
LVYGEDIVSGPVAKRVLCFVVPLLTVGGTLGGSSGVSAGVSEYGVDYYISPPLVQGSYVPGQSEDFNDFGTAATCPPTIANGEIAVTGACKTLIADGSGGATAEAIDPTPTVGAPGSDYASTDSGGEITFIMPEAQRYLGFWWSAGSGGNIVRFFDGDNEVLSLNTDDLTALLGLAPTSVGDFGSTGFIESLDTASTYVRHHYFGNPRGVLASAAGSPPVMTAALWEGNTTNYVPVPGGIIYSEPFVYLHVLGQGNLSFDRVTFSGFGFEFDNFVVSPFSQTPQGSLVLAGSAAGTPPPDFEPPAGGGRTPSIDLGHYLERSELPNTGRRNMSLEWMAATFVAIGTVLIGAQRRMRRV